MYIGRRRDGAAAAPGSVAGAGAAEGGGIAIAGAGVAPARGGVEPEGGVGDGGSIGVVTDGGGDADGGIGAGILGGSLGAGAEGMGRGVNAGGGVGEGGGSTGFGGGGAGGTTRAVVDSGPTTIVMRPARRWSEIIRYGSCCAVRSITTRVTLGLTEYCAMRVCRTSRPAPGVVLIPRIRVVTSEKSKKRRGGFSAVPGVGSGSGPSASMTTVVLPTASNVWADRIAGSPEGSGASWPCALLALSHMTTMVKT